MSFWRKISPTRAAKDFAHEFVRPNPYRWYIVGVSLAATFAVFSVMWQEGGRGEPARPEVFYITSWRDGRSDAEIIKGNLANQKEKDELAAAQKAGDERVRGMYRALGEVSGMDVDKIERNAAADREKEESAKKAEQDRLIGKPPTEQQGATVAPE